jgi:hypothetical protein
MKTLLLIAATTFAPLFAFENSQAASNAEVSQESSIDLGFAAKICKPWAFRVDLASEKGFFQNVAVSHKCDFESSSSYIDYLWEYGDSNRWTQFDFSAANYADNIPMRTKVTKALMRHGVRSGWSESASKFRISLMPILEAGNHEEAVQEFKTFLLTTPAPSMAFACSSERFQEKLCISGEDLDSNSVVVTKQVSKTKCEQVTKENPSGNYSVLVEDGIIKVRVFGGCRAEFSINWLPLD